MKWWYGFPLPNSFFLILFYSINFTSPSTGIQEEEDTTDLGKQDLYKLNQWIQEAVIREQVLETKLGSLQRIVSATSEAAELGWTALMEEDRLLTRIESLENQLIVTSKVRVFLIQFLFHDILFTHKNYF